MEGLALTMPWRAWEHSRGCEGDSVAELRLALIIGLVGFLLRLLVELFRGSIREEGWLLGLAIVGDRYSVPGRRFSRRGGRALRPSSSYP